VLVLYTRYSNIPTSRYYIGDGVEKDTAEAMKCYQKAAEQGHSEAQFNLGDCYRLGEGVEKDEAEGVKWYRRAAEHGSTEDNTTSAFATMKARG
jgi:TPR repeat protein